jgi:soluble lytic murein transglycosylase-like protein
MALCGGVAQADFYRSLDPDTPTRYTDHLPAEGRWELFYKDKRTQKAEQPAAEAGRLATDAGRFAADADFRYASQIQAAATANNLEPALIRAVILVESGYNPSAVSPAGAVGLMQLMPQTARRYKVKNRHDPAQNIHGGAQYLRDLLRMFDNNLHLALAAYNAGEYAVVKHGNRIPPFRETRAYVPKVMKLYQRYSTGAVAAQAVPLKVSFEPPRARLTAPRIVRTYPGTPEQLGTPES